MTEIRLASLQGGAIALGSDTIAALRQTLRGNLCLAREEGYDEARTIWNAMINRHPGVVVRCRGAADIVRAVRFAREHGLLLAVRGGGHNIAGNAVCEGGLLIDLSLMRSVRVNPARRTARVEPGATLGEFDKEAQAFGLATPLGINSTTGVAGLTLGGGFGWLSRKFGLAADNLISVDVVTAEGELVQASATENSDLFWALRGGGGNFGVVSSFEFRLHPVGPMVLSGLIVHPFARAKELLAGYRQAASKAPDELTVWVVLRQAPPLPFLPTEVHGKEILVFAVCYTGDEADGKRELEPLRALGEPIADVIGMQPYAAWQTAFDPLLTPGAYNYWKSHNFVELSDGLLDTLAGHAARLPTAECEIFIGQLGGTTSRVAVDATAYPHRNANFVMNVHTRWREPADERRSIEWARQLFAETAPHATGGVYVNFMPEDEIDRVSSAYGANYARLAALKAKYDPGNLFRLNQNVQPSAQRPAA
ncbi:FAD-binding oxidoreductase [Bradyrhizobium sp. 61]|uniref:FAD-binding oxidoreductase n=1 Tax=unclassified Bradyrhizobium TaxID=2631580 RepID=UPI001FF94AC3|nr:MULTISPECIES: FAD-binding oxidoreductase [unclassified Bradyrhizobium]MCK1275344.1 FAD-binding oxidoreductase [Bradyrhizobium sp. 61]MCK1441095.1 FAD-binding oxidoreductase [Bradyrhizobium sp. 48]MCK1465579.1 FAD-binding oxidoreductase [Bradyrhizobium sp. 2]